MHSLPNSIFSNILRARQGLACSIVDAAYHRHRLPNSYLLAGQRSKDKWFIAQELAAALNCLAREGYQEAGRSCLARGTDNPEQQEMCQNCLWLSEFKHPQALHLLVGQKESGKIPVESARALSQELGKTSSYFRVVIVPNATSEVFHAPSANALLKSIEEPGERTIFFLFAEAKNDVLATIVSRSQELSIYSPYRRGLKMPVTDNLFEAEEEANKNQARVELIRSELIHFLKPRLSRQSSKDLFARVMESKELVAKLREYPEEDIDPDLVVDTLMAAFFEILKERAQTDAFYAGQLRRTAAHCEEAKYRIAHYVKAVNSYESLCLALSGLASK